MRPKARERRALLRLESNEWQNLSYLVGVGELTRQALLENGCIEVSTDPTSGREQVRITKAGQAALKT